MRARAEREAAGREQARGAQAGRFDHELVWGTLALGSLAGVFLFPPSTLGFLPACTMRSGLGLPCPFCGGTHAWHALTHGRVLEAWQWNPLAVALGVAAAMYVVYAATALLRGRRWRPWLRPGRRAGVMLAVIGAVLILANWMHQLQNPLLH